MLAAALLFALSTPPAAAVEAAPVELARWSAEARLDEARRRIMDADYLGARLLITEALAEPDPPVEEATYLLGIAWELGGHVELAMETYARALQAHPGGAHTADLRFRMAECYGRLGAWEDALAWAGAVGRQSNKEDRLKVDLVVGIWRTEAGLRRAPRRLERTLRRAPEAAVTYYQAKAHAALARDLVSRSDALDLDAPEDVQVARLDERARLVTEAESHVAATARLEEPEWVLDGLLTVGAGYESVADDLLAAPAPPLGPDDLALFHQLIAQRAEVLRVKAAHYYDEGLAMAGRLQWDSRRVGELERALAAVQARIETR